jgi:hypothetical protein
MLVAIVLGVGSLAFLLWALVRSVQVERSAERSLWREFGLGLALMALFFATWIAHGIAEWQTYTDQQHEHGEPVTAGDFLSEFGQSTLENWQSEFLQLFAFVTLAALYIHKGSAESKDGEENIEASLRRIEERLGTLPPDAPGGADSWRLPDTASRRRDLRLANDPGRTAAAGQTKAELYEAAKEAGVEGRSTMTKDELATAVEEATDN